MVVSDVTESQYHQPSGFSDLDSTCLCQHMVNYPLRFLYLQMILKDMSQKVFVTWREHVWSPDKILFLMEVSESIAFAF